MPKLDRIILIKRQTRVQELTKRFNTKAQAKFYVKSRGQSFDDYVEEDDAYSKSLETVLRSIPRGVKLLELDRIYLPNYVFAPGDLIITLGQDGLVVNAAKYLSGQNILAVNPDPNRFDGVLLPFHWQQVETALRKYLADELKVKEITMAEVSLNDGQTLLAFNDLFIGPKTHSSARYSIKFRGLHENQSSSGLIVSTPAGSTGWMSSLFNQASGIGKAWSQTPLELNPPTLDWQDRKLIFLVREPFRSQVSQAEIVSGEIKEGEELVLDSQMPETGVIFSDGMEWDYLQFNSGSV
ncbi:MAG: NAD(+)/NADH kinase, partial [Leptonema sp. (in: Bacteria)]|nr:NAD(+)/NADH kinase [Leptonema sp. (in: bacteria)]